MKNRQITVIGHYGLSLLMDVARFPAVGETMEGLSLMTEPGGKGYNQVVAASRLGAAVHFITAVGDDDFGGGCDRDLLAEGVEGRHILSFPGQRTACAFVLNSAAGESEVYVYPGAIRSVTPQDIDRFAPIIRESGLLLLQNEISSEALCRAIDLGHEAGVEIIYNPAPARAMPKDIFPKLLCVTPNETEAAILTGAAPGQTLDAEAAAERLHRLGVPNVIITKGERGSLVSTPSGRRMVPPLTVDVVSTTGAGDSYNAALAVYYVAHRDLAAGARYASVASGLQVSRPGVIAGLPYGPEVNARLNDLGPDTCL